MKVPENFKPKNQTFTEDYQIKSQIKKVERIKKNMISKLKIALLQIAPCKTLEENLEKGIVCCRKAKERGADIALFPEMWSNGYNIYGRHFDEWKAEAISVDSDFINTFGETAKELDMSVGITLLEKSENGPRLWQGLEGWRSRS